MLPTALRKVAILISTLDERSAEALLEQMDAEQAAKVRSALVELDDVAKGEEQQVLAEFLQQQNSPALAKALQVNESAVELEISSASIDDEPSPPEHSVHDAPPVHFLASVPADQLARVLRREQAQTIAAVIAHLAPEQSAGVLEHLPPELATDSLERLATLEPVAPAVLADLERVLRAKLTALGVDKPNGESDRRLNAVMGAMDFRQRERVLLQLSRRNTALAQRLGLDRATNDWESSAEYRATAFRYRLQPSGHEEKKSRLPLPRLKFADLMQLDDRALRTVFAAAEPAVVLLALTGAEERMLSRVMRQLPTRDAAILRERLDHPGPVRLREIEQAQEQLAAIAGRLVQDGDIKLPTSARFAATA
jgi:flagellar motor switch protein FliG